MGQWAVLLFLWSGDGMSQAELARDVAIEPPTMVRTIDHMVRGSLVTRVPDPADGRVTRIHLKERGRALCRRSVAGTPVASSLRHRAVRGGPSPSRVRRLQPSA